jgi:hypothetical protein
MPRDEAGGDAAAYPAFSRGKPPFFFKKFLMAKFYRPISL